MYLIKCDIMIRDVKIDDAEQICKIYNHYVKNTTITFEENSVSILEMENRIKKIMETHPWIVYEKEGKALAYAYGSPWKVRSAYRFSAELTVYTDSDYTGKGIGSKIYNELIEIMEQMNLHCLYGGIALPNKKCEKLHKKLGFVKCGQFNQVGYKFNHWIDVAYWEKILV